MKVQFQSDKAPDSIEQQLLAAATKHVSQQEGVDADTQERMKEYLAQVVFEAMEILKQNILVHGHAYYDYDPRQHAPLEAVDASLVSEVETLAAATNERLAALGRLQHEVAAAAQQREERVLSAPCLAHYQERVQWALNPNMEGGEEVQADEGYGEELRNRTRRAAELLAQVNLVLPRLQIELDAAIAPPTQLPKPPTEEGDAPGKGEGTSHKEKSGQKGTRRSLRSHPYKPPGNS